MNLTIKSVPESIHRKLVRRAERSRRSLNQEIIIVLEAAVTPKRVSPKVLLESIKRTRGKVNLRITLHDIERAIETGRE
jgi:predicted HicB family RNase H-like nuclease